MQDSRTEATNAELAIAGTWTVALFVGLITIAFGVIVLAWPSETLKVLSILLGLQLLLYGVFRLITAFSSGTVSPGLTGFVGVMGIIAGVIVMRNPFETIAVLATVLGVAWIVIGAIDLIGSIADSTMTDRWVAALAGLLSIGAGIIVVAWPAPTLTVIAWITGIYLVVMGIVICASAFRLKSVAA